MKVKFWSPGKSYLKIKNRVDSEMQRVLSEGKLILQEDVERFEKNLATFTNKKYAVVLNSGTDALYLSLWALGIGLDDEVITSSHTFVATVQVITQLGATPILADCNDDFLIDPIQVQSLITDKTKAIIPVHMTGDVALVSSTLPIIEDACQALGAKEVGYGDIQCYSFYPAKILGAYGDAGAITTNSEDIYQKIKGLRDHFKNDGYKEWGINSRMDNLQAAILNVKMDYLNSYIKRRRKIAEIYNRQLNPNIIPKMSKRRVWQDYIINVGKDRDKLYKFLKDNGIETMKNEYPFPIQKLPNSLKLEAETLRIPCNPDLINDEVYYVIQKIDEFFSR